MFIFFKTRFSLPSMIFPFFLEERKEKIGLKYPLKNGFLLGGGKLKNVKIKIHVFETLYCQALYCPLRSTVGRGGGGQVS